MGICAIGNGVLRAVFFDRDGVLNHAIVKQGKPYPPASLADVVLNVEAKPALQALASAGFLLLGITNQPDVARGTTRRERVEEINQYLLSQLPLQTILVCYHDDAAQCECRKPSPGLLLNAAKTHDITMAASFMIGDRWRDIEAGHRAGCRSIWLKGNYDEPVPQRPHYETDSLLAAATWILNSSNSSL